MKHKFFIIVIMLDETKRGGVIVVALDYSDQAILVLILAGLIMFHFIVVKKNYSRSGGSSLH